MLRTDLSVFAQEYSWDELCSRGLVWKLRTTLDLAVIRARDALNIRHHGIANHEHTVRDLKRMCCGGQRYSITTANQCATGFYDNR